MAFGRDTRAGDGELKKYWLAGPGAAKIRWGTPGDFTRCDAHLAKYAGPEKAKRICAAWHHEMTGMYTGSDAHRLASGQPIRGKNIGPG